MPEKYCLATGQEITGDQDHGETYRCDESGALQKIPLCRRFLENPHWLDEPKEGQLSYDQIIEKIFSGKSGVRGCQVRLMRTLWRNRTHRYQNPGPVSVSILIEDYYHDDNNPANSFLDLVLVRRADQPLGEDLSLVAGFMEKKHGDWCGTARAEIYEEANIVLSHDASAPIFDFSFASGTGFRVQTNCSIVWPGAIVDVQDFEPDKEVCERVHFRVTHDALPRLCFPVHQAYIERLHAEFFHGARPPYQMWYSGV